MSKPPVRSFIAPPQQPERRRMRKSTIAWLSLAAIVVIGCGAGFVALVTATVKFAGGDQARDLEAAAAEYRKTGLPWVASDLAPKPPIPLGDNAAEPLKTAYAAIKAIPKDERVKDTSALKWDISIGQLSDPQRELAPYQHALALARKAAERPRLDWHRDYDLGPMTLFPELAEMKALVRFLTFDATLRAKQGETERPLDDLRAAMRLAAFGEADPNLIGLLVRVACQAIVTDAVPRCAAEWTRDPSALATLAKLSRDGVTDRDYVRAMPAQAFMDVVTGRNFTLMRPYLTNSSMDSEKVQPLDPALLLRVGLPTGMVDRANLDVVLRYWISVAALAKKYPDDALALAKAQEKVGEEYTNKPSVATVLALVAIPTTGQTRSVLKNAEVASRANEALMEALIIHARTGRYPTSIKEIPGDWTDGWTKKPLRLKLTKDGIRIYSPGQTGEDHGGKSSYEVSQDDRQAKNYDIVAAYPPITPLRPL